MDKERILIVDDDEVTLKNLTRLLQKEGCQVSGARSGKEALARLERESPVLVLTDLVMDDMSGMELLERIRERLPDAEVVLVTGHASIPTAIEAIKKGAYHYLEKPFRPDEVRHLARQAIEKASLRRRIKILEARLAGGSKEPVIIGRSGGMAEAVKLIRQVAQADCNVLISGESGTGKELAARLIHFHSRRSEGRFLAINCGGFSEELLANELFGHEKDAFTGASSTKIGLLESVGRGTILLDEVSDMPGSMQVKMLRAIQEQEIIRVGGNDPVAIDVRIIAATNQDLKKSVSAGIFRQDLFYRLNVINIRIPSLRERRRDVPLLAGYFLNRACERCGRKLAGISDEALKVLADYQYPGNVRELENIIERAVAVARGEMIEVPDLPPDLAEMDIFPFSPPDSRIRTLKEFERDYIQWVLAQTGRNKTRAAKMLGIDRASLWRHLKRHEIED